MTHQKYISKSNDQRYIFFKKNQIRHIDCSLFSNIMIKKTAKLMKNILNNNKDLIIYFINTKLSYIKETDIGY